MFLGHPQPPWATQLAQDPTRSQGASDSPARCLSPSRKSCSQPWRSSWALVEHGVSKFAGKHTSCLTWASEQVYCENSKNPAGAEGGGQLSGNLPCTRPGAKHVTPAAGEDTEARPGSVSRQGGGPASAWLPWHRGARSTALAAGLGGGAWCPPRQRGGHGAASRPSGHTLPR